MTCSSDTLKPTDTHTLMHYRLSSISMRTVPVACSYVIG